MLCKNCNKEIGQQPACQYCGFNPLLDSGEKPIYHMPEPRMPKPVEVKLIHSTNGVAIAALITSFIMPGLVSWILGFVALSKAKVTHSGRAMAIFSILFTTLLYLGIIAIYIVALKESGVEFQF